MRLKIYCEHNNKNSLGPWSPAAGRGAARGRSERVEKGAVIKTPIRSQGEKPTITERVDVMSVTDDNGTHSFGPSLLKHSSLSALSLAAADPITHKCSVNNGRLQLV